MYKRFFLCFFFSTRGRRKIRSAKRSCGGDTCRRVNLIMDLFFFLAHTMSKTPTVINLASKEGHGFSFFTVMYVTRTHAHTHNYYKTAWQLRNVSIGETTVACIYGKCHGKNDGTPGFFRPRGTFGTGWSARKRRVETLESRTSKAKRRLCFRG